MSLEAGFKLGPYEIIGPIGSGGMGVVYKARDSRLGRTVAIKIVSDKKAGSKEFQQRLRKEAKAASALNHQNIIAIYDVLDAEQGEAIVMEYVEGQSLREALQKKSISIEKAIEITAQAAGALAVAHKAGIVHRDIKPENIILTATHQAKILDFGIAKLLPDQQESSDNVPTQTLERRTETGIVMGTPFYMSPEQAQGRPADWRTDIFALGVVLYEAIIGKRPFAGNNTLEVMHSLLYETPPVADVSPALQDILDKALAKDPEDRYQSAADFALDLRRLKRIKPPTPDAVSRKSRVPVAAWLGIPAVLLLGYLSYRLLNQPKPPEVKAFRLTPVTTDKGYEGDACFFPDGETIAYVSNRTGNFDVFLRQVSGGPDVNLTNDPSDDVQPAVSPDGRWIAFVSTRQSKQGLRYLSPQASLSGGDIWIMSALGGAPRRIAEGGNFPAWSKDGSHIIYTAGPWSKQQLFRVPSSGGTPQSIPVDVSSIGAVITFLHTPSYSPNGKWIVLEGNPDSILLIPATGGPARKVSAGRTPAWNKDGTAIIFSSAETGRNYSLAQISFDPGDGTLGRTTPITIGRGADFQPAVSAANGNMVFSATDVTFNIERVPFGEDLQNLREPPEQLTYGNNRNWFFDTSPNGEELVYESLRGSNYHIWKRTGDGRDIQLTSDLLYNDRMPAWSPDGRLIAFSRAKTDSPDQIRSLWIMSADGTNPTKILDVGMGFLTWMPDSTEILFHDNGQVGLFNLQTKKKRTITNEEGVRSGQCVSPDGRWIAFLSTKDNGTSDVRAVPIEGGKSIPVIGSLQEDGHPFFSEDSKWLYYQADHKNIFRVPGPAENWKHAPPVQVTFFPESGLYLEEPQRTRDSRYLLYSRGSIQSDIWLLSP